MRVKLYCFLLLLSILLSIENTVPLSHKSFYNEDREYERGIFLIILANQSLELYLGSDVVGEDFVEFKKTQGYDVDVISMDSEGIRSTRRYSSNNTSNTVNIDRKQIWIVYEVKCHIL